MPNFKATANSSTATPLSSEETALDSIISIFNASPDTDAFILHVPEGDPPTAAAVVAGKVKLGSEASAVRDQIQLGSPGPRDLARYFVATASGTADVVAIA